MKKLVLLVGLSMLWHALSGIYAYIFDFNQLAAYGKGYLLGKMVLLLAAVYLIYRSLQKIWFERHDMLA
jgi:hypothetical protein